MSMDQHGASRHVVGARDQCRHAALAAAAWADQGDSLAGAQMKVDARENLVLRITELDASQFDLTAAARQVDGIRMIRDPRFQIEDLKEALRPGTGLLADREYSGELPCRRRELPHIGGERQERADGDPAGEG